MRLLSTSTLLTALLISTAAVAQNTGSKAKKLSRSEFDALIANPSQVLILDVRRPDEHTAIGGFPAYLSIQLADLEKYNGFIPRDRKLITVSNHAARGLKAADLLERKGFTVAGAIGVQDYEAEGGKLTRIGPRPIASPAKTESPAKHKETARQ